MSIMDQDLLEQDMGDGPPQKMGRAWAVVMLSLTTFVLITLLVSYILWSNYTSSLEKARQDNLFIANLVAAQAEASLKSLEIILSGVKRELRYSLHDMDVKLSDEMTVYLRDIKQSHHFLMDVLILNSQGEITQWTGKGVPPDVTDRDYARWHIDHSNSDYYLGEPLLSKVHTGQWFFALSLAIRDERRQLQQIVVALVDIELYRAQFRGIEIPPGSSLGLISRERNIITRQPDHQNYVGVGIADLEETSLAGEGNLDMLSPLDHVERIVGYHSIDRYGVAAFSSRSRKQVLADWAEYVSIAGLLLFAAIAILVFLTLRILHNQNAMLVQQRRLVTLANIDGLTGLHNRRSGMTRLIIEFKRARRYQTPLTLFMVDIDHFKDVNDRYGHTAGDDALKVIANILRITCREQDVVSRYGGEEFLVMLPETALDEATGLAERLRKRVEEFPIKLHVADIRLTISIGVSSCDLKSEKESDLTVIQRADRALYRAKNEGRNRVVSG